MWKIKLFNGWDAIIGKLKGKVRIEKITENSITLGVCHSTWAQELFFLTPTLKKKINKILQEEKIKNIHFKTVKFNGNGSTRGMAPSTEATSHSQQIMHSLSIIEHSRLESIDNEDLANALEKFYIRCKRLNHS